MPRLQCEMFGCLIYPEHLSYQELLDLEAELLTDLNAVFQECEAQFPDFFQDGDYLRMSCAFPIMHEESNRAFAQKIQSCLRPELTTNLFFVDKNLGAASLYSCDAAKMREQTLSLTEPADSLAGRMSQVSARRLTPAGWVAEGALPGARREVRPERVSGAAAPVTERERKQDSGPGRAEVEAAAEAAETKGRSRRKKAGL